MQRQRDRAGIVATRQPRDDRDCRTSRHRRNGARGLPTCQADIVDEAADRGRAAHADARADIREEAAHRRQQVELPRQLMRGRIEQAERAFEHAAEPGVLKVLFDLRS